MKTNNFKSEIPIIGKKYAFFDDGKVKPSTRMEVVITEIIPFEEANKEILDYWKKETGKSFYLYSKETDYFIKANLMITDEEIENITFVRTINNDSDWFSLGLWAGRLDVDGSLSIISDNYYN